MKQEIFEIIENVDYKKQGIHYITYRISRTDENDEFTDEELDSMESDFQDASEML